MLRPHHHPLTLPLRATSVLSDGGEKSGRDRAGARRVELTREARTAELTADALDQIVDHFLRNVRHLGDEVVDLRREVVERPHRRNGDEESERRRDERFSDTTTDRRKTARARLRHARE